MITGGLSGPIFWKCCSRVHGNGTEQILHRQSCLSSMHLCNPIRHVVRVEPFLICKGVEVTRLLLIYITLATLASDYVEYAHFSFSRPFWWGTNIFKDWICPKDMAAEVLGQFEHKNRERENKRMFCVNFFQSKLVVRSSASLFFELMDLLLKASAQ